MAEITIISDSFTDAELIADKLRDDFGKSIVAYGITALPEELIRLDGKAVYIMSDPEALAVHRLIDGKKRLTEDSVKEELDKLLKEREISRKALINRGGFDIDDIGNYSVVIDNSALSVCEIAEYIRSALAMNEDKTVIYTSTERLNFPDDEADAEKIAEYSELIDLGGDLPLTDVFYEGGEFYIAGEPEMALAYSFSTDALIPCRAVTAKMKDTGYVKMKNSL